LFGSVKYLQNQVKTLQQKNETLEQRIANLESKILSIIFYHSSSLTLLSPVRKVFGKRGTPSLVNPKYCTLNIFPIYFAPFLKKK
jgi:hypothetical protein